MSYFYVVLIYDVDLRHNVKNEHIQNRLAGVVKSQITAY